MHLRVGAHGQVAFGQAQREGQPQAGKRQGSGCAGAGGEGALAQARARAARARASGEAAPAGVLAPSREIMRTRQAHEHCMSGALALAALQAVAGCFEVEANGVMHALIVLGAARLLRR